MDFVVTLWQSQGYDNLQTIPFSNVAFNCDVLSWFKAILCHQSRSGKSPDNYQHFVRKI